MAGANVKEPNLKKNDFSRLKKTQHILANKFMRESIVAVSKLYKKYAVMLIYASYCLSAVEANDSILDNVKGVVDNVEGVVDNVEGFVEGFVKAIAVIVASIVGILGVIVAFLIFYCQHIKRKEEPTSWNVEQVDKMIEYLSKDSKDAEDIKIYEDLQNLKNKVEKVLT